MSDKPFYTARRPDFLQVEALWNRSESRNYLDIVWAIWEEGAAAQFQKDRELSAHEFAEQLPIAEAVELRAALSNLVATIKAYNGEIIVPKELAAAVDTADRVLAFRKEYYSKLVVTVREVFDHSSEIPFGGEQGKLITELLKRMQDCEQRLDAIDRVRAH